MIGFKKHYNSSNIKKINNHHVDLKRGTVVNVTHDSKTSDYINESLSSVKFDDKKEYSGLNDHIHPGGTEKVSTTLTSHYGTNKNHKYADHLHEYSVQSRQLNNELVRRHIAGELEKTPSMFGFGMNKTDKKIQNLDKALNSGSTPDKMTVFSGVKFHPGIKAAQHPENKLYMPGYTSTSVDPHEALRFSARFKENTEDDYGWKPKTPEDGPIHKHVIAFHLPKGYKGLHIASIAQNSEEQEQLLPRKTSWKLSPVPDERYQNHDSGKIRVSVWHAHPA